jgi:nicotinamide-nucleotide amidase
MRAELITIGDELLIGQVINTNQAYIAGKLTEIGIAICKMTTISDTSEAILSAFRDAWEKHDVVMVTGGLGPTHDDVTKKAVCTFFGTRLSPRAEVRANVERLLSARNAPWSDAAEEQTMFPERASPIFNRLGTAAGILVEDQARVFIAMPGVPYEMETMVSEQVVPLLSARMQGPAVRQRTLRTTGVSESVLSQDFGDIDAMLQGAKLAFLPSPTGVKLRITTEGMDSRLLDSRLNEIEGRIREKAGRFIYGIGEEELEDVVGRMLVERKLTIAVAESCTGGLIADKLTDINGSSAYFERCIVAYSNASKVTLLGVSENAINHFGAVSKEVAVAMAEGVRRIAGTSIGLSTTGIAGPSGGTAEKPIGLVWVGIADGSGSLALKFQFGHDRRRVKERAAAAGLELVRRRMLRL